MAAVKAMIDKIMGANVGTMTEQPISSQGANNTTFSASTGSSVTQNAATIGGTLVLAHFLFVTWCFL